MLVVDASVAVKWYLTDEDDADKAALLLDRFSHEEIELRAPDYIRIEVASAVTSATLGRQARLTMSQASNLITRWVAQPLPVVDSKGLILDAFRLVQQHGCALYDALYLALAQQLDVPFILADRRLYQHIRRLPNVIWLGDYR